MKYLIFAIVFLVILISPASASIWSNETVDSVGSWATTSIALSGSDNPSICYFDITVSDLKYAFYNGAGWETETIDSPGVVGYEMSLAFNDSDYPSVSYSDQTNTALKYAFYNGTGWETETVDNSGTVGRETSLAFNSSDNPGISYYNQSNSGLNYAFYNGTGWEIEVVDSSGYSGMGTSIAFDSSDNPVIAYYESQNYDLKYASYNGTGWEITTVDSAGSVGGYCSLALNASDNPAISYYDASNSALKYAFYNGTGWAIETVDNNGSVGQYTSLALNASGNPAISYYDGTNSALKYAFYNGTGWAIETVDNDGSVGKDTSLALKASGIPVISYHDADNSDLKYATVVVAPVANFTASVTSGTAPLTVSFTDLSSHSPTSWAWDFGDGSTSTDQNPTHTYASAGTYSVDLNASNIAGSNVSTQTNCITVTTASSGSSGTRASVSQGQDPQIVVNSASSVIRVTGGSDVEYDFSDSGTPVLGVSFDSKDDQGLVVAKVQVLSSTPEGVPAPSGNSYQMMSIDVGSEGTISTDNADNIMINFKVSWEWIEENDIDVSTIRMTRYHDGQWNDIPTYQQREEGEYIYFYAETPGFSIFNVVGDEIDKIPEQVPASASATEEETEPVEEETPDTPGFTALAGLVLVSLAFFVSRKQK